MDIKRKLKLFWVQHSDPIIFWSLVFIVVIFITQSLNSIAKNSKQENTTIVEEQQKNIIIITEEQVDEEKKLIEQFLDLCLNKKLEDAYKLLSNDCKKELYPNLDTFKTQYYNKVFNQKREIKIQLVEKEVYKVMFYEDILESGSINRKGIESYYKIEYEILENKLYIDYKK